MEGVPPSCVVLVWCVQRSNYLVSRNRVSWSRTSPNSQLLCCKHSAPLLQFHRKAIADPLPARRGPPAVARLIPRRRAGGDPFLAAIPLPPIPCGEGRWLAQATMPMKIVLGKKLDTLTAGATPPSKETPSTAFFSPKTFTGRSKAPGTGSCISKSN